MTVYWVGRDCVRRSGVDLPSVLSPLAFNPSRHVVLQEDDGCYIADRGRDAAAEEIRKAWQARGMKDSMPWIS